VQPVLHRYLLQIDLAAIACSRDGRLISTRDPSGHEAAWWCRSLDDRRRDPARPAKATATLPPRSPYRRDSNPPYSGFNRCLQWNTS
jgi:hypothetical protein